MLQRVYARKVNVLRVGIFILAMMSNLCVADRITFTYAPSASVKGDVAEVDLIEGDDYSFLTVEPGSLRAVRWSNESYVPLYMEYSSINTEDKDGNLESDKYQSLGVGISHYKEDQINGSFSGYLDLTGGIGVARFNFDDIKYRALGEVSASIGLVAVDRVTFGLMLKVQIVGYPTETMASSVIAGVSVGVNY